MTDRWPYALDANAAAEFCGISRNSLLRAVQAGRAPAPVSVTPRRKVWLRRALEDWLDRLARTPANVETTEWTRADGPDQSAVSQGVPRAR